MAELDEKLNQILNNPQLMQQISSLAQTMNAGSPPQQSSQRTIPENRQDTPTAGQNQNNSILNTLLGATQNLGIDKDQQNLLKALSPFLSHMRVVKLERAMHAARLAQAASVFINNNGQKRISGR